LKLSVVIPTHNRDGALRNTLAAIERQTLGRDEFEILVVDDGSEESIRKRLREIRVPFRMRLVEKPQGGLASARNRGSEEAAGEILHFLDDDVMPSEDAFEQHLASHAEAGEPVAVVGSLPYPPHVRMNSFLWYMEESGHYDLYKHPEKYPGGVPPMPPMNGNSSIPRELFEKIGRYDEGFRQYGSEDLELGYRLAKAGVRFVYNPRAVGYHDHIKDFPRFCTDMERAGESLIQLYRKYPEIKAPKKIDIVEDRLRDLPDARKKIMKAVMETTFALPWLLIAPRLFLKIVGPIYPLRALAFPFYRWVAFYHYGLGMKRALGSAP
jgi:GT2 family glycosyltransferase